MPGKSKQPQIPLPKSWGTHVKSAVLHVIALVQTSQPVNKFPDFVRYLVQQLKKKGHRRRVLSKEETSVSRISIHHRGTDRMIQWSTRVTALQSQPKWASCAFYIAFKTPLYDVCRPKSMQSTVAELRQPSPLTVRRSFCRVGWGLPMLQADVCVLCYRARESIEHVLYEQIKWFDEHVKNAGPMYH
jgi:hypothetical protein